MTETTKKISLNVPNVTFIEETHQYFIGKKELKGVTGTLIKKAFPDTYKNIPESVLKRQQSEEVLSITPLKPSVLSSMQTSSSTRTLQKSFKPSIAC